MEDITSDQLLKLFRKLVPKEMPYKTSPKLFLSNSNYATIVKAASKFMEEEEIAKLLAQSFYTEHDLWLQGIKERVNERLKRYVF